MRMSPRSIFLITLPILITTVACARKGEPSTTTSASTELNKPQTYHQEFTAATWNTHQVDYTIVQDHRQELDIQGGGALLEEHFTLGETRWHSESFAMPATADEVLATAPQNAELDILIVVDNSPSPAMAAAQTNLAQKLQPLLNSLGDIDWQIGVVTTDLADGCLRSLIQPQEPNFSVKFAEAIQAGTAGSAQVHGLFQAKQALTGCTGQAPWIRTGSAVAVLFLSLQDNCGKAGAACDTTIPAGGTMTTDQLAASTQPSYLTDYLAALRTSKSQARVYSLLWNPEQGQDLCPTGKSQGQFYLQAVNATMGSAGSICSADFSATLTSMSSDMRSMVSGTFHLPHSPLSGSVNITIDGVAYTSGFTVQGNDVTLATLPAAHTAIRIAYNYATAESAIFKLAALAAPETLALTLDGTSLSAKDFNFDAASQTITLTQILPGKTLMTAYREEPSAQETLFTLKSIPDITTLALVVGEQTLGNDQYVFDAAKNQIKLSIAPAPGAIALVKYLPKTSHSSTFPLQLSAQLLISLQVTDKATGVAIPFTADGKSIAFTDEVIKAGTNIVVTYDTDAASANTIDLARDIMSFDELTVTAKASQRSCPLDKISLSGSKINLAGCPFNSGEKVTILHKYVASFNKSFILDDAGLKAAAQTALQVSVGGVETNDYTFDKKTNTLTMGDLAITDKVTVEAVFY